MVRDVPAALQLASETLPHQAHALQRPQAAHYAELASPNCGQEGDRQHAPPLWPSVVDQVANIPWMHFKSRSDVSLSDSLTCSGKHVFLLVGCLSFCCCSVFEWFYGALALRRRVGSTRITVQTRADRLKGGFGVAKHREYSSPDEHSSNVSTILRTSVIDQSVAKSYLRGPRSSCIFITPLREHVAVVSPTPTTIPPVPDTRACKGKGTP